MNYQEALAYIYSFTDYERGDKYSRNRDENQLRASALLAELGNPYTQYTSTLIAGTKGKGSTAANIERVLRVAGIRTGLYTQPDLHTFRERMRINGRLISETEVAALIPELQTAVERIQAQQIFEPFITYEIGTVLAFLYFQRQQVQHAIVEVGIGGRQDATNILPATVSVIASISYDHMQILGHTLDKIAYEKAGIIKQNGLVVTSARPAEALLSIAAVAQERHADMIRIGSFEADPAQDDVTAGRLPALAYRYRIDEQSADQQRFTVWTPERVYEGLETPLLGAHQVENATLAIAALDCLRTQGYTWTEQDLRTGLAQVHWPARFQIAGRQPTIVIDGAHNTDSIQKVLQTVHTSFDVHRLCVVLGINRDKDLDGIVQELAGVDRVILTQANNPRSAKIETLATLFERYAATVDVHRAETLDEAMELAQDISDSSDTICVTGSLYLAAEALRWAAAHGNQQAASEIEGDDH